jgi:pilus assembly protein Flp/PilA
MTSALIKIQHRVATTLRREDGATAVEYGLMVALIAVVIIAAVVILGGRLSDVFQNVANQV